MQDEVRSQGPLTIYEAIYTHFANVSADWTATSPDLNRMENLRTRIKKTPRLNEYKKGLPINSLFCNPICILYDIIVKIFIQILYKKK